MTGPVDKYLVPPKGNRHGLALCLSGGGYRAALFHLGALRRLNELGILSQVDTLSCVSGGSIVAAHLRTCIAQWPTPGKAIVDWDQVVVDPLMKLAATNIRTWPMIKQVLPWNWLRASTGVATLSRTYERLLSKLDLAHLPPGPRMIFCATDMVFGVNWVFDSGNAERPWRIGDYQAGYAAPAAGWSVAKAVAASSCFPPVFNPLPVGLASSEFDDGMYQGDDRARLVDTISLTDGGVYDNMALEPVWKDHRTVLVSDGGAVFQPEGRTWLFKRLLRYSAIAGRGGGAVRKRWLIANYKNRQMSGTYWGLGSVSADYPDGPPGYPRNLVDTVVSRVRTDLDAFSTAEQCVLQNHGYQLVDAAVQKHAKTLVKIPVDAKPPYPAWADEAEIRRCMVDSHQLRLLGRR